MGNGGIAPRIGNLDSMWRWVCSFTSRPFTSVARALSKDWIGHWVDPTSGLDAFEKTKIYCSCRESNPGSIVIRLVAIPTEVLLELWKWTERLAYGLLGAENLKVTHPVKKLIALYKPMVNYRVHNSPTFIPILSLINSVHSLSAYSFLKINFSMNIFVGFQRMSSVQVSEQKLRINFTELTYVLHALLISSSSTWQI